MCKRCLWFRLLLTTALALLPVSALSLPSLSISSPGADGVFVLRGNSMAGVSGMKITIGYDTATLSNPRIAMGGLVRGMMGANNPANPIQMALVGNTPLAAGGVIATISFDRTGSSPGAITSLNASLIDLSSKTLPMAPPVIINPVAVKETANQESTSDVLAVSTTGSAKGGAAVVGGTVELPGQEGRVVDKKQPPAGKTAQAETEPPLEREEELPVPHEEETPAVQEPQPALPQPKPVQSVLERFRTFQGERSPANLVALFNAGAENTFRQLPPIAIADGKSTVTLVINVPTGDKAPNFAFDGCKYVALRRTGEGGWEIEARPTKGVVRASVTVLYDSLAQEIPLTVTPKAYLAKVKGRPTTQTDFESFLKQRGTATAPKFDLNKDGKRDYIDDYIYTANYLLQK